MLSRMNFFDMIFNKLWLREFVIFMYFFKIQTKMYLLMDVNLIH